MSLKAGIIGVIRKPGEYQALRRLRGRKKPLGRIPQEFAHDLLKKYSRTTGLVRGSLFHIALFGRAGQLTRNIYRSYNFSIAINNRFFLLNSRIGRPGLLRSGEKYPVDYVAYPPHAQVHRKFTIEKHRSFTAYASLRMPELGMQGPVARAPSASLAGPVSTVTSPRSGRNLALYPAFRLNFLNSLYRHEAATRFPSVLYAAKTSGMVGSHSNWMRNGTSLRETTHERRSVSSHRSLTTHETVHILESSSETQHQFRPSRAGVPTVHFRVQAGRLAIDAAGIGTPVLGVRPERIRTDVVEKLRDTPAPESRPVSFGRPSGKAVSGSFPYRGLGRSWPAASGVKEFQHDTTGYTTTIVRPVMRFASSISSIRSILSGRSTRVLRPVSYKSPASRETIHVLGSFSEIQLQFRPSRAGVRTVPFRVQTDKLGVAAARIGTPILDVRQGRICTDVVEKLRYTSVPGSRPVSYDESLGKAVSGSFPYHGHGRGLPAASGVKEFQHDTTGYITTVVRPVTRFASSISSIRSMLSGRSTQVLRPVGHRSPASLETVHIPNSSSETQHQFRPSRIGIHTVPFRVQTDKLGIAAARIGTPILDIRQGRIQTDVTGELGVTRALDSRPVSSGGPSSKAVIGSFPYHGPGSSVPVVSVLEGPYRVLTGSGKLFVRPITPQKNIPSTAQLPPDAQPYKQDTKDVTPRRDNAFAAHWTEILHKPYTKTISQRIMRNIELINNHYVHRVMGQKPGGDGRHSEFFSREDHGFPWMPASRSRDRRGLEMTHVPMRLPVASSGMEGHTKEGAGTAPVQGSLQVKGPEMSGALPVPEVDAHSLANRVYGLIVERVKRELELRGR